MEMTTQIEQQLLQLSSGQHLLNLALRSRKVRVASDTVRIRDEKSTQTTLLTTQELARQNGLSAKIHVSDPSILRPGDRLAAIGVDGYSTDGQRQLLGSHLMIYVLSIDDDGLPVVRALNGRKNNPDDEYGSLPRIPASTVLIRLSGYGTTDLHEEPQEYRLCRSLLSHTIREYLSARAYDVTMPDADEAENELIGYARSRNRDLWFAQEAAIKVGDQTCRFNKGLRHAAQSTLIPGDLTVAKFMAAAEIFFTKSAGDSAILFAGSELYKDIFRLTQQGLQADPVVNEFGWSVIRVSTPGGMVEVVREQDLDAVSSGKSGAMIGKDSIVTYARTQAARTGDITLMEYTHFSGYSLLISSGRDTPARDFIILWDSSDKPDSIQDEDKCYFISDCPAVNAAVKAGQLWQMWIEEDDEGDIVQRWYQVTL